MWMYAPQQLDRSRLINVKTDLLSFSFCLVTMSLLIVYINAVFTYFSTIPHCQGAHWCCCCLNVDSFSLWYEEQFKPPSLLPFCLFPPFTCYLPFPCSFFYPHFPCLASSHPLIHYTPPSKDILSLSLLFSILANSVKKMCRDTQRHSALSSCVSALYHKLTRVSNLLTARLIGLRMCGDGGWWLASAYPRAAFPLRLSARAALPWWCHPKAPSNKAYWLVEKRERSNDRSDEEATGLWRSDATFSFWSKPKSPNTFFQQ